MHSNRFDSNNSLVFDLFSKMEYLLILLCFSKLFLLINCVEDTSESARKGKFKTMDSILEEICNFIIELKEREEIM